MPRSTVCVLIKCCSYNCRPMKRTRHFSLTVYALKTVQLAVPVGISFIIMGMGFVRSQLAGKCFAFKEFSQKITHITNERTQARTHSLTHSLTHAHTHTHTHTHGGRGGGHEKGHNLS